MKRYLLFAGDQYYPEGGWKDFVGDFNTHDIAIAINTDRIKNKTYSADDDWWHIVDTADKTVVDSSRTNNLG